MRWVLLPSLLCAAALLVAGASTPVHAAPYGPGDVFVSVAGTLNFPGNTVHEYTPSGTPVQTLTNSIPNSNSAGSAFDNAGNFYVTTSSGNAVAKFDTNGTPAGTFGSGYDVPLAIVFDRAGNAYVGQSNQPVVKRDSTGAPAGSFAVVTDEGTDRVFSLDLAADQCTLYYLSAAPFVHRFNVCTNTQLPDLNPDPLPGTSAFGVRVLPDGGVLVAEGSAVVRLNQVGAVVQTYLPPPDPTFLWTSVALDPAGTGFWALDLHGRVRHVDLATGNVLDQFDAAAPPGEGGDIGLSVRGGFVAALVPAAAAPPSHRTVHRPRHHHPRPAAPRHHGCGWGGRAPDASNDPNCRWLRRGA